MDYSLLRRTELKESEIGSLPRWDIFFSAYNVSKRVTKVFDEVLADRKHWLIHDEYGFAESELPASDDVMLISTRDEAEFWLEYFDRIGLDEFPRDSSICVDSTGFMRPHLMLLPLMLHRMGFQRLDVLYTDPKAYESGAKTSFTKGAVTEVRQVRGFEGAHTADGGDDDLLIIGAGYDAGLIRRVAESKRSARKLEMFGLPSLQPHMYEENRLQAADAEEAVGSLSSRALLFAPANDPFATAQELHDRLAEERNQGYANLYLSPLATKPQVLGFALYYLCECRDQPASVIFPFAERYSSETSVGIARVWRYEIELDWFA